MPSKDIYPTHLVVISLMEKGLEILNVETLGNFFSAILNSSGEGNVMRS